MKLEALSCFQAKKVVKFLLIMRLHIVIWDQPQKKLDFLFYCSLKSLHKIEQIL